MGVFATLDPHSEEFVFSLSEPLGRATNNFAEWSSLERALQVAKEKGYKEITVSMDSELVVKQVLGQYKVKHPDLIPFSQRVKLLLPSFQKFRIQHIPREQNKKADQLANQALNLA